MVKIVRNKWKRKLKGPTHKNPAIANSE